MNNTILEIPRDKCTGCSACVSICPKNIIQLLPDDEGFCYPKIVEEGCNSCGLCFKVCQNVEFYNEPQKIYAAWHKDDSVRAVSSSGGVFSSLSEYVLDKGGYVCGAGFSEDNKLLLHKVIDNKADLDDLRRSKFIQSTKFNIFPTIKTILKEGKDFLFCGTPCEVGGLKQFLRKDYNNLYTCDLLCGCVSSPMVYQKYIEFLESKYNSKVTFVNFKEKREGWRAKSISVKFENEKAIYMTKNQTH